MIETWPQLRDFALGLGLPQITLAHPWGHEALKAHGKMWCYWSAYEDAAVFKADRDEREMLLAARKGVTVAHMIRHGLHHIHPAQALWREAMTLAPRIADATVGMDQQGRPRPDAAVPVQRHEAPRRVDPRVDDREVEVIGLRDRCPVVDARAAEWISADAHARDPDRIDVDHRRQVVDVVAEVVVSMRR